MCAVALIEYTFRPGTVPAFPPPRPRNGGPYPGDVNSGAGEGTCPRGASIMTRFGFGAACAAIRILNNFVQRDSEET